MKLPVSARDRRALVLGALAAAVIVAYPALVRPLAAEYSALQARREAGLELLKRYRGAVASVGAVHALAETARSDAGRVAGRALGTPDDEAASSRLLERVRSAAADAGVRVERIRPLETDTTESGIPKVAVRLDAESDFRGILGFLQGLESAETLFHVNELSVSASGANTEPVERLRFAATVYAFLVSAGQAEDPGDERNVEATFP